MINKFATAYGLFVPITYVWDVQQLQSVDVTDPAFKELLVRLYQNINSISIALNLKESGYYQEQEFVTGALYFPNPNDPAGVTQKYRQVFRVVIDFGALPNTGTKSVLHFIDPTDTYTFTRIYGAASDTTGLQYIPLPYASATGDNIELRVTSTNVVITTTSNRTNFNQCYVVVEYIKT